MFFFFFYCSPYLPTLIIRKFQRLLITTELLMPQCITPPPLFKPWVFDHITCARGVGNLTTDYSIAEGGGEFEPEMSSYMYVFLRVPL